MENLKRKGREKGQYFGGKRDFTLDCAAFEKLIIHTVSVSIGKFKKMWKILDYREIIQIFLDLTLIRIKTLANSIWKKSKWRLKLQVLAFKARVYSSGRMKFEEGLKNGIIHQTNLAPNFLLFCFLPLESFEKFSC